MIYFVFYTDWMVGAQYGANTYGPFIFMRPAYRGDTALLEHEKTHVSQFWRTLGLCEILYCFRRFRIHYEVEAYRKQLEYKPENKALYAGFLATKYDLNITTDDALKLLT